jgi:diaminopimelate decarboxylase
MTKAAYERPALVRHQMGMMNKFTRTQSTQPMTELDSVPVAELVERYGSPLFVFSERTLVEKYRELRDLMARQYPRVRLAWSYKTNYLDAICRVFHREGAWAEVVSEFEFDKAVRLGIPPDHIHFNGPYKTEGALRKALSQKAMVHLDHFDELALAEKVARELDFKPKVAIRVNMGTDGSPAWSRFGFNLESGQARDAVRRILAGNRLQLSGLHCHLGTFIQDPEVYRQAAQKMAVLANELRRDDGVKLDFIDLGGGIASRNTLHAQYLPGDQATPAMSRYAEAIADGLSHLDCPAAELPTLVLETGRALVDEAGSLITTVLANKRLPDKRRGVILDAGVNLLFTAFWYKHDVVPAQPLSGLPEPTVLYGPLCMNIDVMRDTMLFPQVKPGDRLIFRTVGAYNVTQWMQFITYRPAVVLISAKGQHAVIRRAEDLEAVVRQEEMPGWLAE